MDDMTGLNTGTRLPTFRWPGSPIDGVAYLASPEPLTAAELASPPDSWRGRVVQIPLARLADAPLPEHAQVFAASSSARRLDPRQDHAGQALAIVGSEPEATALGGAWGKALARAGAAGAVLSLVAELPDWCAAALLAGLRDAAGSAVLLLDGDGLDPARLGGWHGVAGIGLRLGETAGSRRGYDPRLTDRVRALRAVAPAVMLTTEPAGVALAEMLELPCLSRAGTAASQEAAFTHVEILSAPGAAVLATLSSEADARFSSRATLKLLNVSGASVLFDPAEVLPRLGGSFGAFTSTSGTMLSPGTPIDLSPLVVASWQARRTAERAKPALDAGRAEAAARAPRVAIEAVTPAVDDGAFAVKRLAGERVAVEADLICDGHDKLAGAVQWRGPMHEQDTAQVWHEVAMRPLGNDRWQATMPLSELGLYEFRISAWHDAFETFRDEVTKKHQAGVATSLELLEGRAQVERARDRHGKTELGAALKKTLAALEARDEAATRDALLDDGLARTMHEADDRKGVGTSRIYRIDAERTGAAFASWYEIFPRSMADDAGRHGTFADVERHLPRIASMGFDVLYFPPIHPIGRSNRKGPNNTLDPSDGDPGSPYAVGTAEGGHDAIHPELGTLEDFLHLRQAAAAHGLELALDFAIQCSPDHPWLREHRDWFAWRPDGSIRYAENPPKKYQDIVNVDFYADGAIPGLWLALCNVVLFWAENGVRLFRVDNPHTKPLPFWEWMIAEVRARYPDAVFLAEAFTRPKVMNRLAKIGFSQSYTYFTWRNTRSELEEYLTQLTTEAPKDFFRPHFFVNTPDINPTFLQTGGRAGHLIRAALAATLSGLWGVYSGFELCEATPLAPGKEEYLDSEKFQLRAWDWQRAGNIVAEITRLNLLRRSNPALRRTGGISFLPSSDPAVLVYEKATHSRDNIIVCAVCLDPAGVHDTSIELPLWKSGLPSDAHVDIEDMMSGVRFGLDGAYQTVRLTPQMPFVMWRLFA